MAEGAVTEGELLAGHGVTDGDPWGAAMMERDLAVARFFNIAADLLEDVKPLVKPLVDGLLEEAEHDIAERTQRIERAAALQREAAALQRDRETTPPERPSGWR